MTEKNRTRASGMEGMALAADPLVRVASNALRITAYTGQKRRDPYSHAAYVPWTYLDLLADALRAAGIDPQAENLGKSVEEELGKSREEARRDRADRIAEASR